VRVAAAREGDWLRVEIRDDGPGFPAHVLDEAGKAPFPVHAGGSGIGLFLAHASIARLGGRLTLGNDGGGVAQVRLPLNMKA
jgi:two-component system sensor histidine kinase RegB